MAYFEDKIYKSVDFLNVNFESGEYENCQFIGCNLAEVAMRKSIFSACTFENCNLSLADVTDSSFNNVIFKGSKIMALRFDMCKKLLFGATFMDCKLNDSSFFQMHLKGIKFENCIMHNVDFSQCDLTAAVFSRCELVDAVFDDTNLERADFTSAYEFRINPKKNKLKKAKFNRDNLAGLVIDFGVIIS